MNLQKTFLCTAIVMLFATLFALGQESEPAIGSVRYRLNHISDTTKRDKIYEEDLILYFSKNTSKYRNYYMVGFMKGMSEERKAPGFDGKYKYDRYIGPKNFTHDEYYFYTKPHHFLTTTRLLATDYIFDHPYPEISWKIGKETKKVDRFNCTKATGVFAGRKYTVWFTKELPYPFGPWKLQGLPGLILEAEDSKGEVAFKFMEYANLEGMKEDTSVPPSSERISDKEFQAIIEMAKKDPKSAYDAAKKRNAETLKANKTRPDASIVMPGAVPGEKEGDAANNPIELEKIIKIK